MIGDSIPRVDAREKVTGQAMFTDDLQPPALIAKVLHATVAHGWVKTMDIEAARKAPGVVKIVTCLDVPPLDFTTGTHPWHPDPQRQGMPDRRVLNRHVRYYGDDIAAVVALDELSAAQAVRLIKVEYEVYPAYTDVFTAMAPGAMAIHEGCPDNILASSSFEDDDYQTAVTEPGLRVVEGWYDTQTVQHCQMENPSSYAYMEKNRIVLVSSTQTPHVMRRVVAQALGIPWGDVRVIKPYVGGGFGNKEDALYEPLNAYLCRAVGGRCVRMSISREECFVNTRVRHAIQYHLMSHVRSDGTVVARSMEAWSNQGAYSAHGHAVVSNGMGAFRMLYDSGCCACRGRAVTVYTNLPCAGAMRGYGAPQVTFALESHAEDICVQMGLDPLAFRRRNMMPAGLENPGDGVNYPKDTLSSCLELGTRALDFSRLRKAYAGGSGPLRRGVGMAMFWYRSCVYPHALDASACRMLLNQDGTLQVQLAETEIGQGADTAFTQMAAAALTLPEAAVHLVTWQDTDLTPFGTGAYASRQTYVGGKAIYEAAAELKRRMLARTRELFPCDEALVLEAGCIREADSGRDVCTLQELALSSLYNCDKSLQLCAEVTSTCKTNALSLGCAFAEVEVDIPLCKIRVLRLVNVHDAGTLINPALAKAQVQGGMSMALGYALAEQLRFDAAGKPLNNNLLDYKLPTCLDHPERLEVEFVQEPEPTHPFGAKALGEPPTVPVAAAIRNAVLNAVGVPLCKLPMDPHACFEAFQKAGLL